MVYYESDISKIDEKNIQMDIICAGFPCQSFSNAGKRKSFKDKEDYYLKIY